MNTNQANAAWEMQQKIQDAAAEIVIRQQEQSEASKLYTIPGQDGHGAYGSGPYGGQTPTSHN